MDGTLQIAFAAVTTGSILGPGGANIASHPQAAAAMMALLLAALLMSGLAAWRASAGSSRYVPPGPALPKLRRRLSGPRDRRA
ncbi:MAG TPA: hypothetical protein VNZ50_15310 [Hyphomicrobiaceae bacterium]|jgi:hypothetical protein|nr:hypothetical protein [Hyphomicrobiaceae bacterium]